MNYFKKIPEKINEVKKRVVENVMEDKKTWVLFAIGMIAITLISYVVEFVLERIRDVDYFNVYNMLVFWIGLFVLFTTALFRKKLLKQVHNYFFVIVMLIGSLQVLCVPQVVGVSWDDEIHYGRAAHLSWGGNGYISEADAKIIDYYDDVIYKRKEYSHTGRAKWEEKINRFAEEHTELVETNQYAVNGQHVAYVPSAIVLALGRVIGLDFTTNFVLGKWINLLIYAFIIRYAIKILPKGKLLLTAIGLIPTNIFLAASYSYDWWVTSFVILGYALFLRELQLDRKISTKMFVKIMVIMVVGMLPKAVYFPLIFPMCILKKERYENSKLCRILGWASMFLLIATFLLPMLVHGAGEGDSRGGEEVNSTSQIDFILQNPLSYARILGVFMVKYLALERAYEYLVHFAYLGTGPFYIPALFALFGSAIAENAGIAVSKENKLLKYGTFLAVIGSLILSATAIYISFTEVGYPTIMGCQRRYILPTLFPFLFFLCGMNVKTTEETKVNILSLSTVVMACLHLWGLFSMCTMLY